MKPVDILNKIIEENGNCCWSRPSICAVCPMSKLKQRPDGSWMNCVEALGAQNVSEEEADIKYKEMATKLLLDSSVEEMLEDNNGIK